ncbi:hypothetical protein [Sporosarcina aquimarina]|uniref:Lipoprotein n=1 Tax=Sporosarcina aquimarina TaxID=114975 RepID=A0ABU4G1H1_9BACL|nr:hypothetical protein [Sporosarcina aquimarina]MDW0110230.1 hypothetical protein [Sporosarcina aquimarina]
MKKFLVFGALSIMLAGCADNDAAPAPEPTEDESSSLEENATNTPPEDESEAEEQASEDDGSEDASSEDGNSSNELSSFEEYSTINEVQDVSSYNGIVETDNPGTRVILFEDENGKKVLKSVFVKNEKRLKVISLEDDGQLYNEILK